jgi:deoxyribodipyrimidine photo-lyase
MNESIALFWFRRDLRLEDNHGLFRALSSGNRVVPIFIFDPCILDELPKDDHRVGFIWAQLKRISAQWLDKGTGLQVFYGAVETVFEELSSIYSVAEIHTNRDYEPYARQRDEKIARWAEAKGIAFHTHQDQVIFEPQEVVKSDGTPYLVYTPFSKAWLAKLDQKTLESYPSEEKLNHGLGLKEQMVDLALMGFTSSIIHPPQAHTEDRRIADYAQTRNFPFLDATTKVGVHLRFGTISVRSLVHRQWSVRKTLT